MDQSKPANTVAGAAVKLDVTSVAKSAEAANAAAIAAANK